MMEDLQDVGKTPDEKHRFTIHRNKHSIHSYTYTKYVNGNDMILIKYNVVNTEWGFKSKFKLICLLY